MSGRPDGALDEFGEIGRLFRPLTRGAPGALGLLDDAALVASRPGHELVITKDAIVEGVHFLSGEDPALVGRRLAQVNLSDLAAKGAEPFAVFLAIAWPPAYGAAEREAFARGLGEDLREAGVSLLGGDTVGTPGPLTASLTALGWVPEGGMVRRAGARPGDRLMVSGHIGDAWLGLAAARGGLADPDGSLTLRYRNPRARLDLAAVVRAHASAAADVSDGLIADAGHLATAGGLGLRIDLDHLPISSAARAWLNAQPAEAAARIALASGGDDYEIVATSPVALPGFTVIGEVVAGEGVSVFVGGARVDAGSGGWSHK
jgi:thiamine-monophosphate kinase